MIDVYCHTSPSGKRYVGICVNGTEHRWKEHVRAARRGSANAFHRAIRKYGPDAFTHEVLERMTTEAGAKRAEQLWIERLGTFGTGNGYNATRGGDGALGHITTPEARAKISAAHMGNTWAVGRRHKPETIAKMRAAAVGRVLSAEHHAKLSVAARNRAPEVRERMSRARLGFKHSDETRAKMRAAHARRKGKV